ncbi:MAG: hypothetical protein ETSY1_45340, partial [Candidatus Entotheonella factor]
LPVVFEGKQDLEKQLVKRLRGWQVPDTHFVVMRDQDSGNCFEIKDKLTALCREANRQDVLVRIACRELESFYLGDLVAVEKGLGINNLSRNQDKKKFRAPDELVNPVEELRKLTGNKYQKVSGSRAIGPCLSLTENRSHSFHVLVRGIRELVA